MATVQLAEGSAHAQAVHSAIQSRLLAIDWAPEENDTTLADYITMMLVHGKDENAVRSELAGDLLGVGEDDPKVPQFTKWLFETAQTLGQPQTQQNLFGNVAPEQTVDESTTQDASMSDAEPSNLVDAAPSGPKAMRSGRGRGRGGRMLGQMNRQMDRSQDVPESLRRIKGAAGGRGGRIDAHAGRDAPRGPRGNNLANGLQRMMNTRPNGNPQSQQQGGMLGQLDPQNQMIFMQMMEMQAQMMQQMAAQGQLNPGAGGFKGGPRHKPGFDPLDKRGQNKLRNNNNPDGESSMDVDGEKKKLFDIKCRFNEKCTNPDCGYAHQSPAVTKPNHVMDMNETCSFASRCTNFKCAARHPSPCTSELWQQRQHGFVAGGNYQDQTLCRFYPNCTRGAECPFIHSDQAQTSIPCRYNPCTKIGCPFIHADGQQQAPVTSNVWTANGNGNATGAQNGAATKVDRFAGFQASGEQPEELIRPDQENAEMDTGVPT